MLNMVKLTVKGIIHILNLISFRSDLSKAHQIFISLIRFVCNCSKMPSKEPSLYFIPRMISFRSFSL